MVKQIEVSLEIIFHATEDNKKVLKPIFELFQIKEDEFSQEKILGYYGNQIILAKAVLVKKQAEDFVKNLVSRIPKSELDELVENLDMYLEDSSLFLRISKSKLVSNIINLQQNDAIKIKIKIPVYKKSELAKTYMELLKV